MLVLQARSSEPPVALNENADGDAKERRISRFELKTQSVDSAQSSTSSSHTSEKSTRSEAFNLISSSEADKEEPLKAKSCHLRKSRSFNGYGLVLKSQQQLHVIGAVEEASPAYRAGLRENDVIVFVGKKNVEKVDHDDIKVMIRAASLTTGEIELTVIAKGDMPRYKTLQEKGLIDWSVMGLER